MNGPAPTISADAEKLRRYLKQIKPGMHLGDYTDILSNIVHYACAEASRLSRLSNSAAPLQTISSELEQYFEAHLQPRRSHVR